MNLLIDTHVFIWALRRPAMLPRHVADLISDHNNEVFVSAASIWEIAIKHALGRPGAPPFSAPAAIAYADRSGMKPLPITMHHAAAVEALPALHGDPFDRLILAQALADSLRLITRDRLMAAYSESVITW